MTWSGLTTAVVMALLMRADALADQPGEWVPVAIVSQPILDHPNVSIGGEGGQVPLTIVADAIDGEFMLFGTDVGGLFRSTNGGNTWEPANVGFSPRGASAFAIDPRNPDRVLAIGCNSMAMDIHGIYLSTDGASSWRHVQPANMAAMRDYRHQIAFDPSSYDDELGYCTDAYWSRIKHDKANYGQLNPDPALYRSSDGGATWMRLPESKAFAGGSLVIHPTKRGVIYVATDDGVFVSKDRAETFDQLKSGKFTGLAVTSSRPDWLYANTVKEVWVSHDAGQTWESRLVPSTGEDASRTNVELHQINVSPADPQRLSIRSKADDWRWLLMISHDGGKTWVNAEFKNELAFLPHNVRNWVTAWHPTDANKVYSFGGDWATRSTDGGKTFEWSAEGINTILVGGAFHFSPADPDVVFLGSQDYNGAITRDGGKSWQYAPVSDFTWGGFTYAGMAADTQTMFVGNANSWNADRTLRISRDGGKTWTERSEISWSKEKTNLDAFGHMTSFVDPANRKVFFAGPFRSHDLGQTWSKMEGCDGVFTASAGEPGTLFGVNQPSTDRSQVVSSQDHGATWQVVLEVDGLIKDVAVSQKTGEIFFTNDNDLRVFRDGQVHTLDMPRDQFGNRRMGSVAIDPQRPERIFATQHMDRYIASRGALMSDDGGQTWQVLTITDPLAEGVTDGGREPIWVRVHPKTGDAWFSTSCFGVWKYRVEESAQ